MVGLHRADLLVGVAAALPCVGELASTIEARSEGLPHLLRLVTHKAQAVRQRGDLVLELLVRRAELLLGALAGLLPLLLLLLLQQLLEGSDDLTPECSSGQSHVDAGHPGAQLGLGERERGGLCALLPH